MVEVLNRKKDAEELYNILIQELPRGKGYDSISLGEDGLGWYIEIKKKRFSFTYSALFTITKKYCGVRGEGLASALEKILNGHEKFKDYKLEVI